MTEALRRFLSIPNGSGDGDGDGSGYGYGDGYGIFIFNSKRVYQIDDVATIITAVYNNAAKGFILQSDLTLTPCYVVKQNNIFAHGNSLKEAMDALRDKLFKDMSEDERIEAFLQEHSFGVKYPAQDLFEWHHRLTGSCEAGRKAFVRDRGIDMSEKYTVEEFINICKDSYGGNIIRRLHR